jgi:hypothetical protein
MSNVQTIDVQDKDAQLNALFDAICAPSSTRMM